jgi:hypothetical protein
VEVDSECHHCDACCRAFRDVEGEAGHEEEDGHEREGDEEEGAAAVAGKGEKSQSVRTTTTTSTVTTTTTACREQRGGNVRVDGVDSGSGENPVESTKTEGGAESRDLIKPA